MLLDDLTNSVDITGALHAIENSLITGEKLKNLTQIKQVLSHFGRIYSYYRNKKESTNYLNLFIALIKNCLAPKLFLKEIHLDKIHSSLYYPKYYDGIYLDGVYLANLNQGWIPEDANLNKIIDESYISYSCLKTILDKNDSKSNKILLKCRDLFSPVYGPIKSNITYVENVTGYGKRAVKETYDVKEHLLFLQNYVQLDLNEFYETIFNNINNYIIPKQTHVDIFNFMCDQFSDNKLFISKPLFFSVYKSITFGTKITKITDLLEPFSKDETLKLFTAFNNNNFDITLKKLIETNKIQKIESWDELSILLKNNFNQILTNFNKIYYGQQDKQLLINILTLKDQTIELDGFIKPFIESNNIELDDELFVSLANCNQKKMIEYFFENKYQLNESIVMKIFTPKIIDIIKMANEYHFYITDKSFNHIYQLLFYAGKTQDDIIPTLKLISIYKNEDKEFEDKKASIVTYGNELTVNSNIVSTSNLQKITKEMIVNANKPQTRYYLLEKYLEQLNTTPTMIDQETNKQETNKQDTLDQPKVKRIVKKVVKKIIKKNPTSDE